MKLYFDSMIWVYYLEGHPTFGQPIRSFVQRTRSAHHDLLASNLILGEVLVLPKRNSNIFQAAQYRRLFHPSAISLIPFTTNAAELFADICATTRAKPADALHLALAASAAVDYFVTTDTKLHGLNIPGIGHICPPDAVP